MLLKSLLPVLLAAGPAAALTMGNIGFAIGTKHPDGSCKTQQDYEDDFRILAKHGSSVRGYDANDCNFAAEVLPAAKKMNIKVTIGIWADEDSTYENGKTAVATYANQYKEQVEAITVGSETLYRGNFTGQQLLQKVLGVKRVVPDIPVGTADSWNKYADGTADPLIGHVDVLYVNAFAYWQGQHINNASHTFFDDIMQAVAHIQKIQKSTTGLTIKVGETGWPTGGQAYEAATPGVQEAADFYKAGVCGMVKWGIDVYVFEAFDEPWKPVTKGDNGQPKDETHWGVYTADKKPKYDLSC